MPPLKAGSSKKRRSEAEIPKSKAQNAFEDDIFGPELSTDIKEIMSALHHIRDKAQKDGQRKNEETISSVASEIKSIFDDLKSKIEKERQTLAKALLRSSRECENALKTEAEKLQMLFETFSKGKAAHFQAIKDVLSKFEEEREKLLTRYEQQRKKEKNMLTEHEKTCTNKITHLEESLKKKKQDDKTFSILRKTLGSFLDNGSDEEFPPDD